MSVFNTNIVAIKKSDLKKPYTYYHESSICALLCKTVLKVNAVIQEFNILLVQVWYLCDPL